MPLLPFPGRRILLCEQIPISSVTVQNPPALLPPKSVCPLPIGPSCRCRSQPLPGVSRKQRYNTLDFPRENRVPTGVLLALLETQSQRGCAPLDSLCQQGCYSPLLDDLEPKWLKRKKMVLAALLARVNEVSPKTAAKSALGKALRYLRKRRPYLETAGALLQLRRA